MLIRCRGNVFTEPLLRNGPGIIAYLAVVACQPLCMPQYNCQVNVITALADISERNYYV
jgi:hypothetical protein